MVERRISNNLRVAFFGSTGSGKSTCINAAVGASVCEANDSSRGVT